MQTIKKRTNEDLKRNPNWEFVKTILIAIGLAMIFRSFFFEPFHIPSGSMKSNLVVGDYIFVSKFSYGYSRYSFPFGATFHYFDGRKMNHEGPKRGDVVVFRLPTDPHIDYIKRVMGLPGDRIQVTAGVVYINGVQVARKKIDDWYDADEGRSIDRFEEVLPEGKHIRVLGETTHGPVDNTPEYTVPPGHYFMMGDNRDNSTDSRYMDHVGFVPEENLVGRADLIMLSVDLDIMHPRWERSLNLIQ